MEDPDLTQRLYDSGAQFSGQIIEQASPILTFLLTWILPIAIFIGIGQYMSKKLMNRASGGPDSMIFGMGKSNAKVYVKSSEGIRFSDVAGEDEAKENLSEIVDYLHNPAKYREIGASMPKGILLVGPPGTGKTMLAKAVAGESNVPFFSMSGSEFVEMFVGMGASKVRDLFRQAKEKAPCIVFIDEIDAIGQKRDGRVGGNDEREQTLNQLLTEMDGFESNNGVIILAATNRPESLDPALTRPGRFDRRVPVELPDLREAHVIIPVRIPLEAGREDHEVPARDQELMKPLRIVMLRDIGGGAVPSIEMLGPGPSSGLALVHPRGSDRKPPGVLADHGKLPVERGSHPRMLLRGEDVVWVVLQGEVRTLKHEGLSCDRLHPHSVLHVGLI